MKKILAFITAWLCAFGLVACTSETESTVSSDMNVDSLPSISASAPQGGEEDNGAILSGSLRYKDITFGSGNDSGFYTFEPMGRYGNILFIDYQTHKQDVFCSDAGCTHDNDSCIAYHKESASTPSVLVLDDKLVYIYPGNPYYYAELGDTVLPRIDISGLDGTNKQTIATYGGEIKLVASSVAYDDENLYVLQEITQVQEGQVIVDASESVIGLLFQQINLTTGETHTITEFADLDKQSIHFSGASDGHFVFKRILYGEWDESISDPREQWDHFVDSQVHEVFTIDSQGELSEPLFTFMQGAYSTYMVGGKIYVMGEDTSLFSIDPESGNEEKIVDELPYEHELLQAVPQIILNDWLIIDLAAREGVDNTRYAVNLNTHEYKTLNLTINFDGLTELPHIYAQIGDEVLVCVAKHTEPYEDIGPDGSATSTTRTVEDWALMKTDDFLQDNNTYSMIEKYSK